MKSQKALQKGPSTSRTAAFGNPEEPRATTPDSGGIRVRVYEIYVERGQTRGQEVDNGLRAEKGALHRTS